MVKVHLYTKVLKVHLYTIHRQRSNKNFALALLPLTYLCCCSAFALRMLHFIWSGGIGLVAGCEGGNLSWLLMNVFTSLCGRCVCACAPCVIRPDCWSRPFNRACAISDASTTIQTLVKSHVQSFKLNCEEARVVCLRHTFILSFLLLSKITHFILFMIH